VGFWGEWGKSIWVNRVGFGRSRPRYGGIIEEGDRGFRADSKERRERGSNKKKNVLTFAQGESEPEYQCKTLLKKGRSGG